MSESSVPITDSVIECNRETELDLEISDFFQKAFCRITEQVQAEAHVISPFDIKNLSIIQNLKENLNKLQDQANFQNVLLFNVILNKLEDSAEDLVGIRGANTWVEIKKLS